MKSLLLEVRFTANHADFNLVDPSSESLIKPSGLRVVFYFCQAAIFIWNFKWNNFIHFVGYGSHFRLHVISASAASADHSQISSYVIGLSFITLAGCMFIMCGCTFAKYIILYILLLSSASAPTAPSSPARYATPL